MGLDFLSLPPQIKLAIAGYLGYKDRYHLALTCWQNWSWLQHREREIRVKINKLRNQYEHLDIKPQLLYHGGPIIQTLHRVLTEPAVFQRFTKSLNILDPRSSAAHHDLSLKKYKNRSNFTFIRDEERDLQLRNYYQQGPLQAVHPLSNCTQGTLFERLMLMALITSIPKLEKLALEYITGVGLFADLMMRYWQNPDLFPHTFRHLTHVQLAPDAGGSIVEPILVYHVALLPSMRRIDTIRIHSDAPDAEDYRKGKSNVQELSFQKAALRAEWMELCLPMYTKLKRFSCSSILLDYSFYHSRAMIKALLHYAAHSLLSLHLEASPRNKLDTWLENQLDHPDYYHPASSLKHFQNLQLLRCEWNAIVATAEYDYVSNDPYEFPLGSGRLVDVLPTSLVVLQITQPLDDDEVREQLIEYLKSRPAKLRRIDWNTPSGALMSAAGNAGVELHPVVGYEGWSCVIGCDCDRHPTEKFGILMPPEI